MTQPFYQEQQSSQHGANQQMLLCPVRLVYETQILVQPGEQIHPNQTIFINPQNPPPWIQNRPQNQVLYVQQIAPNNYIPQVQHQTSQNQLYMHQNFNNVQQIMPQQIVSQTQHREVKSTNIQMTNVLQRNTAQGQTLQTNTGHYNPNLSNEAQIAAQTPNFGILPPNYVPNQMGQNQVNFIPANINKQVVSNVQVQPRSGTANAVNLPGSIEMHQNVYRPMHQQTFQHERNMPPTSLPQSITVVPIQSGTSYQNPSSDNNIEHNVTQIRPVQLQIANTPRFPQPAINTVSSYPNDRIAKKVAAVPPKGVNSPVNNLLNAGPKNVPTYSYRPIQPRPQQPRNMAPSLVPTTTHPQIIPPTQSSNVTNLKTQNIPTASSYVKTEPNILIKKRKSESPDEVQNKIIITNITQKNKTIQPVQTTSSYNSIGVNTLPVQKGNNKIIKTILNNPNITLSQTNEERKDNVQRLENQASKELTQTSETEKLLRNTVFTQARNRVLADKQEVISANIVKVEPKANDVEIEPVPEKDTSKDTNKDAIKKDETIKEDIKVEVVNQTNVEAKEEEDCKEPNNITDTTEPTEAEESIKNDESTKNVKEINLFGNSKSNDQNGFVLTHVLDGYVIQESNVAFPIRRPLKEKTLQPNIAKMEVKKEEPKNTRNETNDKIFNLSLLQVNETDIQKRLTDDGENGDNNDNPNKKENPFEELKSQVVKTWTVDQLTTHLSRYNWDETVSVLREHEIDGESLFLVSKNQLMTIGVNEEHAGVICDFVKN